MTNPDLSKFSVSGWDDDLNGITEEPFPHETPTKEILWASEQEDLDLDLVKRLLKADPMLVNARDGDGYTPLHRACYSNNPELVELLLSYGADVGAKTDLDWEPLHSACHWNNYDCVIKLLQYGADVNVKSNGGQTPLHISALHGASFETVQLLLAHPYIKPDLVNSNNETAFTIASRSSKYYKIFDMAAPYVQGIEL